MTVLRGVFRAGPTRLIAAGPATARTPRAFSTAPALRSAGSHPQVAVLYQALEPPVINGVRKPKKPGGYQDSGADIAYLLSQNDGIQLLTPGARPDPTQDAGWTFPDTEAGILSATQQGATHLWANTIVFAQHPLQTSTELDRYQHRVKVVSQPPLLVEMFDDKNVVNSLLRRKGGFNLPRGWTFNDGPDAAKTLRAADLPYPVVAKPVRGRGSHGVKVCNSLEELVDHATGLFAESPQIMVEEFLVGEEATVTVMPPTAEDGKYWALPVVTRFNHQDGIAPYNGVVAVTSNSRAVTDSTDPAYAEVLHQCEQVAALLRVTAPIRIDVRRYRPGSNFALFDVNMKPNMTGPGRPGREDQASLTLLAAQALGWDYAGLLARILHTAIPLGVLRSRVSAGELAK